MKIKWTITAIIGLMMQAAVFAQDKPTVLPEGVTEKGWWVVESNTHSPRQHIVYFYNNDGALVYKEKIEGMRLKPEKRATKMRLKRALETVLLTWEKQHQMKENQSLVVNTLKGK